MRTLPLSVALVLVAATASLQAAEPAQERERIAAERKALQERSEAEQKACWQKFAVNDCINNAKRRQRQALAELRQQEIALNDSERKKRAAERTQALDEKAAKAASRLDPERREQALAEQQRREARAAEKAAKRPSGVQHSAPGAEPQGDAATAGAKRVSPPVASAQPQSSANQEEANRKRFEERQQKAEQRKARVLKRQAEKGKQPAASLPLPP